jgi:putative intracellular protease/amidase
MAHVLFVLTSHTQLGDTGRETGFYFEELAAPYWILTDAGHTVEIASIAGGGVMADPNSLAADFDKNPAPVRRFVNDADRMVLLQGTPAIADVDPAAFDAIFLPGGHGVMWDFPENAALAAAVGTIYDAGGVVGAVCHGPAGLLGVTRADGKPLVEGLKVNGFTDSEEAAAGLTEAVPFLLETELRKRGGLFEGGADFTAFAVRDGRLVTGQNPMSSEAVAQEMVAALDTVKAAA